MPIHMIQRCARCGTDHEIKFKPLQRPSAEWTHWGMCLVTNEPVMMQYTDDDQPEPPAKD